MILQYFLTTTICFFMSMVFSAAEYHCLCVFDNLVHPVYREPNVTAHVIGFLPPNQCKYYLYPVDAEFGAIMVFHQKGFIHMNTPGMKQICEGKPLPDDIFTTLTGMPTTTPSTTPNSTATPSTMPKSTGMLTTTPSTTPQSTDMPTNMPSTTPKSTDTLTTTHSTTPLSTDMSAVAPSTTPKVTGMPTATPPTTPKSTDILTTTPSTTPLSTDMSAVTPSTTPKGTGMPTATPPTTPKSTDMLTTTPSTTPLSTGMSAATPLTTHTSPSSIHTTTPSLTTVTVSKPSHYPNKIPEGHTEICPGYIQNTDVNRYHGFLGQYGDFCYELVDVPTQWGNAERHCSIVSTGHLVHVLNLDEQDYLVRFLNKHHYVNGVWLGLNDNGVNTEGTWRWSSGAPYKYNNFKGDYNQHSISEHNLNDCVVLKQGGEWTDVPCGVALMLGTGFGESHPYICQYNVSSSLPSFVQAVPDVVVG